MEARGNKFRRSLEELDDDNWIFFVSVGVIVFAFLFSGFRYFLIDQAMMLFFYAVLVRIWTQMGSGLPMSRKRDWAHAVFIVNAIAAVMAGISIEWFVSYVTGDIIAIQSLAIAVVISRLYINIRDKNARLCSFTRRQSIWGNYTTYPH